MQTSSISSPANVLSSPPSNSGNAAPDSGETAFNQLLSREVAERRNVEAPRSRETEGKPATEKAATGDAAKPAAESQPTHASSSSTPEEPTTDAAAQASAELLALVANVAQLQSGDGDAAMPAEAEEAEATLDLKSGRKRGSPFASQHAAIGARGNHGTQSKPDGTWAAQVDHGSSQKIEPGKADGQSPLQAGLPLQTGLTDGAAATRKVGANGSDFGTALKDASQLVHSAQQQPGIHAQPLASQVADKLSPRVGSQGWDQALGQKVVWMVSGEQQSASLTLNPPDLGPLKVVLQITNAQANASFIAASPEVRQALEAAMPKLRDMLGDAGIQLGQATVDSGAPEQQHASERQTERRAHAADGADMSNASVTEGVARVRVPAAGLGLVDTFA